MSAALFLDIAEIAISLAKSQKTGEFHGDLQIEENIVEMIQKSVKAHHEHTGKPLDPALIKAEEPIYDSRST